MELKDIKAVIDLMKKNDLSVFEMEKDGFKLKLQKGAGEQTVFTAPAVAAPAPPAAAGAAAPAVRRSSWMPPTSAASSPAAPAPTAANPGGCSPPKSRFERESAPRRLSRESDP